MLEVLWLRLPGKTKTYQARAVINNYAQGWRLRNFSLCIKLSISALVCLELGRKAKTKECTKFFFIFVSFCFFFFFSYCQFLKSFLRGRLVFGKKNPWQKQSTVSSRHFYVLLLLFYTRSSNSTRGRAQNRRESRQKEKTSRSMDVSMYARTYDALHFRYSRPLLDLYETSN